MSGFEFCLFTSRSSLGREARQAGIDHLMIDWETRGKHERQLGAELEQNFDTPEDLRRLKSEAPGSVVCRINGYGVGLSAEVDVAVECGADVVFLPMVRQVEHVEEFLERLGGRAAAGILVETAEAVALAPRLGALPLDLVYVGLNDLALSRGTALFDALRDGTVERVRRSFTSCKFGFGGLTVSDRGTAVPTRLLALEMSRLRCDFTFLRRSFKADVQARDMAGEVRALRDLLTGACNRSRQEVDNDRRSLHALLQHSPVVLR